MMTLANLTFKLISELLVVIGGAITVLSFLHYRRTLKCFPAGRPTKTVVIFRYSALIIIALFFAGYVYWAIHELLNTSQLIDVYLGVVFLLGALMVFFLVQTSGNMINELAQAKQTIEDNNINLEDEVSRRTGEIRHYNYLEDIVSKVAAQLLGVRDEDFASVTHDCLGIIARALNADRVYLWKNGVKNGQSVTTQLFEWSEGVEPQQGKDITVNVSWENAVSPETLQRLSDGLPFSGIIREMPQKEQAQLGQQGIQSILMVPILMDNHFWGFLGVDDCHSERDFPVSEEVFLRSCGLLIANALHQREILDTMINRVALHSAFLNKASHDLRKPANAIINMAAITRQTHDPGKQQDYLTKIDGAAREIHVLLDKIIDNIMKQDDDTGSRPQRLAGRRVLIAEDSEVTMEILKEMADSLNLAVDCACDGQQAFDMYRKDPRRYDIVFMDIQMPNMDGITATRKIRELEASKPLLWPVSIVGMTANAAPGDIDMYLQAGMTAYLSKPFDFPAFTKTIAKFLG